MDVTVAPVPTWTRTLNERDAYELLDLAEPGMPLADWRERAHARLPQSSHARRRELVREVERDLLDHDDHHVLPSAFLRLFHAEGPFVRKGLFLGRLLLVRPGVAEAIDELLLPAVARAEEPLSLAQDAHVPGPAWDDWLHAHLPEETVGLLAGVSLLLIPVSWREGRFALTWREAVAIDWGTILVFAGGMALGKQLFETGLAHALGAGVATRLGVHHTWTLAAVGIVLTLVVSEAASNTASATVMVPVMIAVAQGAGADPVPVALASCLASSFGFLLPVSTGPNALAYGTGEVTIPEMMRRGFALDVIGAVSIFVVVRVVGPLVLP